MSFTLMKTFFYVFVIFEIRKITGNDRERGESGFDPHVKMEVKSDELEYSSEYATNTTFPIKMKEEAASVSAKLSTKKQPSIDLISKYENEEEIVSRDSGASAMNAVINEKLCRFCHVKFRFYAHYDNHFKFHHPGQIPYNCRYCPFGTTRRNYFIGHIKKRHSREEFPSWNVKRNKMIECEKCHTEHRGVRKFQIHISSQHKGVKLIKCGVCGAGFSWYSKLAKHELEKHEMHHKEFQCKSCKHCFLKSDDLEIHVKKCADRQAKKKMGCNWVDKKGESVRNACCECGAEFKNVPLLKHHFKIAHPEVEGCFVCKICGKRFNLMKSLELHTDKFHEDEGELVKKNRKKKHYTCPYCGDEFQGLKVYEEHGISAHGKDRKLFHCGECGDGFNRKRILNGHVKCVHKGPTRPCVNCGKLVPMSRIKRHEKTCGMGTTGESIPYDEKLFRCRVCDKIFDSKFYLKVHALRKHGKAEIPCPHCGKCFSLTYDLKAHEKICGKRRSWDSPKFFCAACRKTLYGSAKWHRAGHENYDRCVICDSRFHRANNPRGLSNHMMKRHPDHVNNCIGPALGEVRASNTTDFEKE